MLDLKINHLQLLAQIVSTGSLTEAAQNLGLSAAAASRMLKKLQTEMNDPLFIRVWRGLTPTDTTTMMLPVVRELLEQMERLEYQKSFTPAKLSATITIGAADQFRHQHSSASRACHSRTSAESKLPNPSAREPSVSKTR